MAHLCGVRLKWVKREIDETDCTVSTHLLQNLYKISLLYVANSFDYVKVVVDF